MDNATVSALLHQVWRRVQRLLTESRNDANLNREAAAREPDERKNQSPGAFHRRRVLEEASARLLEISMTLANAEIGAGELRQDANELGEVMHRIEWLADITAT